MDLVFEILIPLTLVAVLATLGMGMYALYRGGEFSRTWSNRLMRLRVLAQFIAILLIIAVAYFTGHL